MGAIDVPPIPDARWPAAGSTSAWSPLWRRVAGLGPDTSVRDDGSGRLPGYVRGVLADWATDTLPPRGTRPYRNLLFLLRRDDLPDLHTLADAELLDLVDAVLANRGTGPWRRFGIADKPLERLERLLTDGGAAWRATPDGLGLERRVDTVAAAAVATAAHTATAAGQDPAAEHLRAAWAAAYGVGPDPDRAYDEAVLAVEAVACPLVCPANPRRTLGTVVADLRDRKSVV